MPNSIQKFAACFFTLLTLAGCQSSGENKLGRIDDHRGVKEFILGDSLYQSVFENHRNNLSSDEIIETKVWGHVLNPNMKVDFRDRFLYGIEIDNVTASAVDGKIWSYLIKNDDIPSRRAKVLKDSLVTKFGQPTHVLDSVYVVSGSGTYLYFPYYPGMSEPEILKSALEKNIVSTDSEIDSTKSVSIRRWEGKNVSIELNTSHQEGFTLGIYDQRNVEKLQSARRAIDSTLKADAIAPIRKIGRFSLLTTKQDPVVEVEDSSAFGANYTVPYKYVKPFFGIENKNLYGEYGDIKAITTSAGFVSTDDSLTSLTVKMSKTVKNPKRRFTTIGEVNQKLMSSIGSPAITVKNKTFREERKLSIWPGTPISVITGEEESKIYVRFARTRSIGAFQFFGWLRTPSSLVVWPHIVSWPQNKNT